MEIFYFVYNNEQYYLHVEKYLLNSEISFELKELISENSGKAIKELNNECNFNHIIWINKTTEKELLAYLKIFDIDKKNIKLFNFSKSNNDFNKLSFTKINQDNFFVSEIKHRKKLILNKEKDLVLTKKNTLLPTSIKKLFNKFFIRSKKISKKDLFLRLSPDLSYSKFGQLYLKEELSFNEEMIVILNGIKIINSNYFSVNGEQFEKSKKENNKLKKDFLKILFSK